MHYFLCSICLPSYAQVTLGSRYAPSKGTLLDLKENEDGTSNRGLVLPRVLLTTLSNIDDIDGASGLETEHTGLTVYNIGEENPDRCDVDTPTQGMHVWDGKKWLKLGKSEVYVPTAPLPTDPLFFPNTYMAHGGEDIVIPVEKAYRVWEYLSSAEGHNRLDPVDLSGTITTEIVWMDLANVVTNVSVPTASDRDATFTVTTSGAYGNAVVAVKINNITRWTWHIWVTEKPYDEANPIELNGRVWMNRNLGATSNQIATEIPAHLNSTGTYYQWGRKDPFPASYSRLDEEPALHTGVMNKQQISRTDRKENLHTSITSPNTFLFELNSHGTIKDWYATTETDPLERWDNRWDGTSRDECDIQTFQTGSFMNPCPQGWTVPVPASRALEDSPWYSPTAKTSENPIYYTSINRNTYLEQQGYTFDKPNYMLGYFPTTGFRTYYGGDISNLNNLANYWAAIDYIEGQTEGGAFMFTTTIQWVRPAKFSFRCLGAAVRCVKS